MELGVAYVNRFAFHLPSTPPLYPKFQHLYVSGRCHVEKAIIELNEPNARQALFTLAHEGGHWTLFQAVKRMVPRHALACLVYKAIPRPLREACADERGWKLLLAINAPDALGFTYDEYTGDDL